MRWDGMGRDGMGRDGMGWETSPHVFDNKSSDGGF